MSYMDLVTVKLVDDSGNSRVETRTLLGVHQTGMEVSPRPRALSDAVRGSRDRLSTVSTSDPRRVTFLRFLPRINFGF